MTREKRFRHRVKKEARLAKLAKLGVAVLATGAVGFMSSEYVKADETDSIESVRTETSLDTVTSETALDTESKAIEEKVAEASEVGEVTSHISSSDKEDPSSTRSESLAAVDIPASETLPENIPSSTASAFRAVPNNTSRIETRSAEASDNSSEEDRRKVEEENRKRLEYFKQLNESGASRIEIPEGMTTIDDSAFQGNKNLKVIVLPSTLKSIGRYAFSGSGLEKIILSSDLAKEADIVENRLPASLKYIGQYAFSNLTNFTNIKIHKELEGAEYAFSGTKSLTDVTFEDGMTHIPHGILYNTGIKSVVFPDSVVSIGSSAFANNAGLTEISLGQQIKEIGSGAFAGTGLKKVSLPEGLKTISDYVFSHVSNLTSVNIPSTVTSIGNQAFYDTAIESITLPNGLTSIGQNAFSSTRLKEVTLPESLEYLGGYAFSDISTLTKVNLNSNVNGSYYNPVFYKSPLKTVIIGENVTHIGSYLFQNQTGIREITLPAGLKSIGDGAFSRTGLTKVNLPSGLTSLGSGAFSTSSLTTVNIPASLESGSHAFSSASNLRDIQLEAGTTKIVDGLFTGTSFTDFVIPEGVTSVGNQAFSGNSKLTTITVPSTIQSFGDSAFSETGLKTVVFPKNMKTIPAGLLSNTKVESIVIPEGVEEIGNSAFYGNRQLKSVKLPSTLKRIGDSAFAHTGIAHIEIPKGVEIIGNSAFSETGIEQIDIPSSVETIGDHAFLGSSLSSITLSQGLKSIGNSAFYGTRLKSIALPDTVTDLGYKAFYGTKSLTQVRLSNSLKSIQYETFIGTALKSITIPSSVESIGYSAFSGLSSLTELNLSPGLKRIGIDAFAGTSLTDLTLPSGLEFLDSRSFSINSLESVFLPSSLKTTDETYYKQGAFALTPKLKKVTFEVGTTKIADNLFVGTSLKSIQLPDTITEIGAGAFYASSLEEIKLPANLKTIGDGAFKETKLSEILIPDSVDTIGYSAFASNTSLTKVILPARLTKVSENLFESSGLTSISLPETVEVIEALAFKNTNLTELQLPEAVHTIGDSAFENSKLTSVTIPNTVKQLGRRVFSNISSLIRASVSKGFTGGEATFSGNTNLAEVMLEDGLTHIPDSFFSGTGLTSITLPSSVESIGSHAFSDTKKLTAIQLPENLTTIDYAAFVSSGLESVNLPNSLTNLGQYAFDGSQLGEVTLSEGLTYIPSYAFSNTQLQHLTLPASIKTIYEEAFANARLKDITFAEGLERIYRGAFRDNLLEKLTLPESLIELHGYAFGNNDNLVAVYLPSKLTTVGSYYYSGSPFANDHTTAKPMTAQFHENTKLIPAYLFNNAKQLVAVKIPEGVTEIKPYAFYGTSIAKGNEPLYRLELPDSLESIGEFAFGNIKTLDSVNIPKHLTTADRAFSGSTRLNELRNKIEGIRVPDGMFENTGLSTFIVPDGITEIGKYAFLNNKTIQDKEGFKYVILPPTLNKMDARAFESTEIETIDIPNSVSEIGEGAFRFNPYLTSIKLPKELKALKGYLFEGNKAMSLLVVPNKVEQIDSNAFVNMEGLTDVYLPASVTKIGDNLIANKDKVTFHVAPGSVAETYLKANGFKTVEQGDEYRHYNDEIVKSSSLKTRSQNLKLSGNLSLRLEYELDTTGRDISDVEIIVTLPDDKVSFDKSDEIVKKGTLSGQNKNVLTLKNVNQVKDVLNLNVKTTTDELAYLDIVAQVRYTEGGIRKSELLGHVNEEMPFLTVNADDFVTKPYVFVSGKSKPNSELTVKAYKLIKGKVSGEPISIERVTTIQDGKYNVAVPLELGTNDIENGTEFKIEVEYHVKETRISNHKKVVFNNAETMPRIIWDSFVMKHNGSELRLNDGNPNNEVVIFRPDKDFSFEVQLENDKDVDHLELETIRNGKTKIVRLKKIILDNDSYATTHKYVFSGKFGEGVSFIPDDFRLKVIPKGTENVDDFKNRRKLEQLLESIQTITGRWSVNQGFESNNENINITFFKFISTLEADKIATLFDSVIKEKFDFSESGIGSFTLPSSLYEPLLKFKSELIKYQFITMLISPTANSLLRASELVTTFPEVFSDESQEFKNLLANLKSQVDNLRTTSEFLKGVYDSVTLPLGLTNSILKVKSDSIMPVFALLLKIGDSKSFEAAAVLSSIFPELFVDAPKDVKELIISLKSNKVENFTKLSRISNYLDKFGNVFTGIESIQVGLSVYEFLIREIMFQLLLDESESIPMLKNSNVLDSIKWGGNLGELLVGNHIAVYRTTTGISMAYDLISLGGSVAGLNLLNLVSGLGKLGFDFGVGLTDIITGAKKPTPKFDEVKVEAYRDMMQNYFLDVRALYSKTYNSDYFNRYNQSGLKAFYLSLEPVDYVIDPSGTVTNSVTGNTLAGVQATVYFKDAEGREQKWQAEDYSQLNPVLTNKNGQYAWDVPEGLWKVKVSKDGYADAESDWLPVAPVQTGIDFKLVPKTYRLTYNLAGGSLSSNQLSTYQTDVEQALPTPSKEGYQFDGWYDNQDYSGDKLTNTLFNKVGDRVLWAKWRLVKETKVYQEERILTTDVIETVDDATLPVGQIREEASVNGKVTVEITEIYSNGQLESKTEKELLRVEPTAKKVYRGTKEVVSVPNTAPTADELPVANLTTKVFQERKILTTGEVEYLADPTLNFGQTREEASVDGQVILEITEIYVEGILQDRRDREVSRVEPTAKKVYRGTKEVVSVPNTAPTADELPVVNLTTKVFQESKVLTTGEVEHLADPMLNFGQTREEASVDGQVILEITEIYVEGILQDRRERVLLKMEALPRRIYQGIRFELPNVETEESEITSKDVLDTKVPEIETSVSNISLPKTSDKRDISIIAGIISIVMAMLLPRIAINKKTIRK